MFTASQHLDFEAGLGVFLGPGNRLGETIEVAEAGDHLFGVTLLNGWVARDLENWEGQAFLSRNFATSMAPWVVTMEALEPFRKAAPERVKPDPPTPAHLDCGLDGAFGVAVEAWVKTAGAAEPVRSRRGDLAELYWTLEQMTAHLASNGCAIRPGDLLGTGPLALGSGRGFIEDGDEVTLRGYCETPGFVRIGLGQCRSVVRPASAASAQA